MAIHWMMARTQYQQRSKDSAGQSDKRARLMWETSNEASVPGVESGGTKAGEAVSEQNIVKCSSILVWLTVYLPLNCEAIRPI
jgi:hypothetical protein